MTNTTDQSGTIRAVLDDDRILVQGDAQAAPRIAQLPGVLHNKAKLPPGARYMPLNVESIMALRKAGARASRELLDVAKRIMMTHRYVESQKQSEAATPLRPIPLKPGIKPFSHQVRAYNIALALFGYATEASAKEAIVP